jgi:hypothetical protein
MLTAPVPGCINLYLEPILKIGEVEKRDVPRYKDGLANQSITEVRHEQV